MYTNAFIGTKYYGPLIKKLGEVTNHSLNESVASVVAEYAAKSWYFSIKTGGTRVFHKPAFCGSSVWKGKLHDNIADNVNNREDKNSSTPKRPLTFQLGKDMTPFVRGAAPLVRLKMQTVSGTLYECIAAMEPTEDGTVTEVTAFTAESIVPLLLKRGFVHDDHPIFAPAFHYGLIDSGDNGRLMVMLLTAAQMGFLDGEKQTIVRRSRSALLLSEQSEHRRASSDVKVDVNCDYNASDDVMPIRAKVLAAWNNYLYMLQSILGDDESGAFGYMDMVTREYVSLPPLPRTEQFGGGSARMVVSDDGTEVVVSISTSESGNALYTFATAKRQWSYSPVVSTISSATLQERPARVLVRSTILVPLQRLFLGAPTTASGVVSEYAKVLFCQDDTSTYLCAFFDTVLYCIGKLKSAEAKHVVRWNDAYYDSYSDRVCMVDIQDDIGCTVSLSSFQLPPPQMPFSTTAQKDAFQNAVDIVVTLHSEVDLPVCSLAHINPFF